MKYRVELGGIDVVRPEGVGEQRHSGRVRLPGLGGLVRVGERQRPRLQRHRAAGRADEGLLETRSLEDLPGVGELGEPEPGRVVDLGVVADVGDDMEDSGHGGLLEGRAG